MPLMSGAEERQKLDLKEERKQTLLKFWQDLKASYLIWIRIGGIITGALILVYLFTRFVIKWDLFYETDLKYSTIFFIIFVIFLVSVGLCGLGAYFLYNTKHKRNTKYKDQDIGRGGV